MGSNLLSVAYSSQTKVPLWVEYGDPGGVSAPYLVSASDRLLWVPKASSTGTYRAGFRVFPTPGAAFQEVVDMVHSRASEEPWGCFFPLSESGALQAASYFESCGVEDIELLVPEAFEVPKWMLPKTLGHHVSRAPWLKGSAVVVVPRDRHLLGTLLHMRGKPEISVAVQNARRFMAFLG